MPPTNYREKQPVYHFVANNPTGASLLLSSVHLPMTYAFLSGKRTDLAYPLLYSSCQFRHLPNKRPSRSFPDSDTRRNANHPANEVGLPANKPGFLTSRLYRPADNRLLSLEPFLLPMGARVTNNIHTKFVYSYMFSY